MFILIGMSTIHFARTTSLNVAYEQSGPPTGRTVVLLHGFPYDIRQYDEVRKKIEVLELHVIVPYLRGFGPTAYLSSDSPRSGQQAALGKDVIDFLDALKIEQSVLVGYDWGGRAACVAAALWPDRVRGLVSSGYSIQDIAHSAATPQSAEQEHQLWYQWYFQTDRGRLGLERNRKEFCKLLWKMWSPGWAFREDSFARTAESFENPDFVATAIHSYRHRYGNAPGDPALDELEQKLKDKPPIPIPAITVHGGDDRVEPASASIEEASRFTAYHERRIVPGAGHCIPAEAADEVSQAIHDIVRISGTHGTT